MPQEVLWISRMTAAGDIAMNSNSHVYRAYASIELLCDQWMIIDYLRKEIVFIYLLVR